MSGKDANPTDETQKTPRGHEIPVPTEGEFLSNLEKAAKPTPKKPSRPRSPKK
jgi:hypothetical protein